MTREKRANLLAMRIGWRGLLASAGAVACAATILGFLGGFAWWLDLFSHFRMQYLAGLAMLAAIFLAARNRKIAGLFALFAGLNVPSILPLYLGPPAPPGAARVWRVMLVNVNTQHGDANRLRTAIETFDPDIIVLEEVDQRWMERLDWLGTSHPQAIAEPRGDNFGIALFSRIPLLRPQIVDIGSAGVHSITATLLADETEIGLLATHPLPPAGAEYSRLRNEQLRLLPRHIDSSEPFLLVGDLNTTPWNSHFRDLVKGSGLSDSSRGFGYQPTWPTHLLPLRIPLDHVLHSEVVPLAEPGAGGFYMW